MKHTLTLLIVLLWAGAAQAQLTCDSSFVKLDNAGTTIVVDASGADDTANVQCALDEATSLSIPTVRLAAGEFSIGSLQTLDFSGTLQGTTRAGTIIRPTAGANCGAQQGLSQKTAWAKFIGGAVQLRTLSIDTRDTGGLCSNGATTENLVQFTGRAEGQDCASDVIQSGVDRVDFLDDYADNRSYTSAVTAEPEQAPGGCFDTLLGTFKVNRSSFTGMLQGVYTTMAGSAQVDINFNFFELLGAAVWVRNGNQSTTVLRNEFILRETADLFGPGTFYRGNAMILSFNNPAPVNETRLGFENNSVLMGPYAGTAPSTALSVSSPMGAVNINLSVRNNRFEFDPAQMEVGSPNSRRVAELVGVNDASIAGNRLIGNGGGFFMFTSNGFGGSGNAFTGNSFNQLSGSSISQWGIYFDAAAGGNTVGPGQSAPVWDNGPEGNNFLAAQGNDLLNKTGAQ